MKEYLTGALNDGINGFLDNWVQRHAGWLHGVDHRPSRWLKTQKRLNEPNSKNANLLLNIEDFTNFAFFKK
jgi:hypothetical protein